MIGVTAMDEQEAERGLLGRGEQLVEQRERRLVRPVEILEYQAQRSFSCERADELVEPVERLVSDRVACEIADPLLLLRLEHEAEEAGEEGIGLVCLVGERARELRPELEPDAGLGIGDAQTKPAAELLAHRPIGDRLGIGDGVTREEADAPGKALLRLGDETRLPDSRLAGDRDNRALSLEQPFEGLVQRRQLLLASDQRRLDARREARRGRQRRGTR